MTEKKLKLNITWLYPKEMSTYGDRGNIVALKKRCEWREIDVAVEEVGLKEPLREDWTDLYFFGGGQDRAQIEVAQDLKKYKKEFLTEDAASSKVFLGICGGYQLFGSYYKDGDGNDIEGLGILDIATRAGKERLMGNLVIDSPLLKDKIVGFENHSGKTFLGQKASPLGQVIVGNGNNGEDRTEGAVQNNVFGCYLHGPVLPKNPGFADYLIKLAIKNRHGDVELKFINDSAETLTHLSAIERSLKTH